MWFATKVSNEERYTKKAQNLKNDALRPAVEKARRKLEAHIEELIDFQGMANVYQDYVPEASASFLKLAENSVARAKQTGIWMEIVERELKNRGL